MLAEIQAVTNNSDKDRDKREGVGLCVIHKTILTNRQSKNDRNGRTTVRLHCYLVPQKNLTHRERE